MRVGFVVNDLQLSGGVGVVVEHARQVARHGITAELILAREWDEPDWGFRGLGDVTVTPHGAARAGAPYDVVLATWWETVEAALHVPAKRHAYFVQSLEDRFYFPGDPLRLGAVLTHDLPLAVLTEARWIAETLEATRGDGSRALYVRNGVAKDVFVAPTQLEPRLDGPLRILVEGRSSVWFKGVGEALAACSAMGEPHHVTLVSPEGGQPAGADVVIGPLTAAEMAAAYARSDVVLKLSRVEGMFGPPLEGMHCGATCVVSAVTGHEEYVEHGVNGLVVDWDDPRGTARALDLLARDRTLLHELRCGALATARAWPSWEQSGLFMAGALREIARRPPPDATVASARLLSDLRAGVEAQRLVVTERDGLRYRVKPLDWLDAALQRRPIRWVLAPARRGWRALRRVIARRGPR